ncbi:predicted protein [Chaetomium globosum CBS 148.51]|uniref:Uncharacterized protein n=1 Tax=Chaetomium globosum (strain ATCC 6205 / CBS 148.51 / DSM 1962 / NBRC 6347 / NRRL 1970) TaxID=306901 RepID=Q2H7Q8_CHAGB|nr:uncharacterized protein CHGG_05307 [Chaetomium globosum CBS 148.51]EAQ88688.1 predicted protein [Chaetomium globosum CBS 148.51]
MSDQTADIPLRPSDLSALRRHKVMALPAPSSGRPDESESFLPIYCIAINLVARWETWAQPEQGKMCTNPIENREPEEISKQERPKLLFSSFEFTYNLVPGAGRTVMPEAWEPLRGGYGYTPVYTYFPSHPFVLKDEAKGLPHIASGVTDSEDPRSDSVLRARITQIHYDGQHLGIRQSRLLSFKGPEPTPDAYLMIRWMTAMPIGDTEYKSPRGSEDVAEANEATGRAEDVNFKA